MTFFNSRKIMPVMIILSALIVFSSFVFVIHQTSGAKILTMFYAQPAYIEFKDMYPDAVESFSGTNPFVLKVIQTDEYSKSLVLEMSFDIEEYHYDYKISCKAENPIRVYGFSYHSAIDYLLDDECLGK